jgi:hypothetical protein
MVAKGLPGGVADKAVVLMAIEAMMREYEIRGNCPLHFLEMRLHFCKVRRKKPVRQFMDLQAPESRPSNKQPRGRYGFVLAGWDGRQDQPVNPAPTMQSLNCQERPAAADLDIVTVRANAEYLQVPTSWRSQNKP